MSVYIDTRSQSAESILGDIKRRSPSSDAFRELVSGSHFDGDIAAAYFYAKLRVLSATTDEDLWNAVSEIGIDIDPADIGKLTNDLCARKALIKKWPPRLFPDRDPIAYHGQLLELRAQIVDLFSRSGLPLGLISTGSLANGKINGSGSDVDLIVTVPRSPQLEQPMVDLFTSLKHVDVHASLDRGVGPIGDIRPVIRTGHGYGKVLALTGRDGIACEFFVLGEDDLRNMNRVNLRNEFHTIRRVTAALPKRETFTTADGQVIKIGKGPYDVQHYLHVPGELGSNFGIGFFPQAILAGEVMGNPPSTTALEIQQETWETILKMFLIANGGYSKNGNGYVINSDVLNFSRFIQLFYYSDPKKYSPDRLKELERRFISTASLLSEKYRIPII